MLVSDFVFRLAMAFLVGLAISSFWSLSWFLILIAAISGFLILLIDRNSILAVLLIGFSLGSGFLNYQIDQRLGQSDLWKAEEDVVLLATVTGIPDNYSSGTRLSLKLDWPILAKSAELKGNIGIFGDYELKDYRPGQKLIIAGKIAENSEDFQDYRLKENKQGFLFYPRIKKVGFNWLYVVPYGLSEIKLKAEDLINSKIAEPSGSLFRAMLLGQRIPADSILAKQLQRTGLNHIAVVSGMHLIILIQLIGVMAGYFKMSPKKASQLSLIVILVFVLMTGGRPSILRAGLMTGFGLIGHLIGRIIRPGRALFWAGIFLLINNPLLLRWDVGFQLSFSAAAGLIYLSPLIKRIFRNLPGRAFWDLLAVALSAQLATAPLVAYYFGVVSLIGLIANIMVISFLPIIFSIGLVFLFSGGLAPISFLLNVFLFLIVKSIYFLSGINWAVAPWVPTIWFILIYYLAIMLMVFWFNRRERLAFHALGLC